MAKEKSGNWFVRHKILTALIVIIIIAIAASAGGSGKKGTTTQPTKTDSKTTQSNNKQPTSAKIGEAARDGKFEFTVKSVDCTKTVVGPNQYVQKTAQGKYCLVDLTVKNIGDQQQYFSETDQKLVNATGQEYSADTTATAYNSNNSDALIAQINPGNTVEGTLVYDIPKDQTPVTAILHDSPYSNGVKVSLNLQ